MARKVMFNYLELAYSPISNYVFSIIKNDERFQQLTEKSTLYIITQRKELLIDLQSIKYVDRYQVIISFDIRQKDNPHVLKCDLAIYQPNIASDISREIQFHSEYAFPKPNPLPESLPRQNIINLLLYYHDGTFVSWLSPENFIQNYLNGNIEASVTGPIENFLKYKVHYVGKSTEQNVWKRLTGHSTLQEILSLQHPLHYGTLPTHEIALLFLKFSDALKVHSIGPDDEITQDMIDTISGRNLPPEKTISLDAEKALINAMQPKYNKEFYKRYPKSKDGLHDYLLDAYSFSIRSNIILEYENGFIKGSASIMGGDSIVVEKGQPLKVLNKHT
jgi:hypothetical protein